MILPSNVFHNQELQQSFQVNGFLIAVALFLNASKQLKIEGERTNIQNPLIFDHLPTPLAGSSERDRKKPGPGEYYALALAPELHRRAQPLVVPLHPGGK